ncbi:MAG TPA: CARDB domain-containing protein [Armatimonadota bacterium]|jgi:hypothetical protein
MSRTGRSLTLAFAVLALLDRAGYCARPNGGRGAGAFIAGEFTEPRLTSRWGYGTTDQEHFNTITGDKAVKTTGDSSILFDTGSGFDAWVYFPDTKDLDLDVSKATEFRVSLKSENANGWGGSDPWFIFHDMQGRAAQYGGTDPKTGRQFSPGGILSGALKDWVEVRLPIGADATARSSIAGWRLQADTGFDWRHLASFEVHADTGGYSYKLWLDNARFEAAKPLKWFLSSLDRPDLTVTYAEQTPRYRRYFPKYENGYPEMVPGEAEAKHWPSAGEKVSYGVHIRNVGRNASKATQFECRIDGKLVKKARVPALKPRQETTVNVPWNWKQGAYPFEARVDTGNTLDEITRKNNVLTFNTDAYTLDAFCEKGMTELVDGVNNYYGSFSYEDWLRGATVDNMNRIMKHSRYDFAPNGAPTSVRIDRIVVVDKITDDVEQGPAFGTYDGSWKYPTGSATEYRNLANTYMWALDHELTHQIGIIDDYNLDLAAQANKVNGKPFSQPNGGMMGGGDIRPNTAPAYANIDVAGMKLTYGKRRGYFGEYLYAVPTRNTLSLTVAGKPLANAEVIVYQKHDGGIADDPIQTGTTDAQGRLVLANRPVKNEFTTATGMTLKPNPFGHIDVVGNNGLFLVRAKDGAAWRYGFLPITDFVVEYARGHREEATFTLEMAPE